MEGVVILRGTPFLVRPGRNVVIGTLKALATASSRSTLMFILDIYFKSCDFGPSRPLFGLSPKRVVAYVLTRASSWLDIAGSNKSLFLLDHSSRRHTVHPDVNHAKTKETLKLHFDLKLGKRKSARCVNVSHSTVVKYLERAEQAGLAWPLPAAIDYSRLEQLLFGKETIARNSARPLPKIRPQRTVNDYVPGRSYFSWSVPPHLIASVCSRVSCT
jgi:hypothetical protein